MDVRPRPDQEAEADAGDRAQDGRVHHDEGCHRLDFRLDVFVLVEVGADIGRLVQVHSAYFVDEKVLEKINYYVLVRIMRGLGMVRIVVTLYI